MIILRLASKTEISTISICNDARDLIFYVQSVVCSLCIFVKIFYKTKEILINIIAVAPAQFYLPPCLSSVW